MQMQDMLQDRSFEPVELTELELDRVAGGMSFTINGGINAADDQVIVIGNTQSNFLNGGVTF
jgi:hypothetical protein